MQGVLLFFFLPQIMNPAPSLRQDPFSPSQSDTYSSLASIYAARLDFHMGAWSTNGTDGRKALMRLITMKDATVSQKVPLLTSKLRGDISNPSTPPRAAFLLASSKIHSPPQKLSASELLAQSGDTVSQSLWCVQPISPQILNLCFPEVVEILAVKGGWRKEEIETTFQSVSLNKGTTIQKLKEIWIVFIVSIRALIASAVFQRHFRFIKPGGPVSFTLDRRQSQGLELRFHGQVTTTRRSQYGAFADGIESDLLRTHCQRRHHDSLESSATSSDSWFLIQWKHKSSSTVSSLSTKKV